MRYIWFAVLLTITVVMTVTAQESPCDKQMSVMNEYASELRRQNETLLVYLANARAELRALQTEVSKLKSEPAK